MVYGQTIEEENELFTAAFIYNFIKFTDWPDSHWAAVDDIRFCISGNDNLVDDLQRLNHRVLRGRTLKVEIFTADSFPEECHLLYFALSETLKFRSTLLKFNQLPVLTISRIEFFAAQGGMIEIDRGDGQTHLTINLVPVNNSELKISSRLLILADILNREQQ